MTKDQQCLLKLKGWLLLFRPSVTENLKFTIEQVEKWCVCVCVCVCVCEYSPLRILQEQRRQQPVTHHDLWHSEFEQVPVKPTSQSSKKEGTIDKKSWREGTQRMREVDRAKASTTMQPANRDVCHCHFRETHYLCKGTITAFLVRMTTRTVNVI
jgi:hypothetical protein